jgi:hypothetical protein
MWKHGQRLLHTLAAVAMGAAGSALLWAQTTITGPGPMTVGTTDATDVKLVTNNTERVIVNSAGHLLPAANNTYNLGSSTLQWGSAWLGGNLSVGGSGSITGSLSVSGNGSITGNLSVGGSTVTLSGIPGGSTATDVLVRTGAGNVQYRAASGLVGTYAWLLGGNSLAIVQTLGTQSNHDLPIITNNTERMRITATGNVGIGTANPTERLQVSDGNIAITNTNNIARQLRLYEPSGSGANYTAFVAQAQASNIIYTLPASLMPTSTVAAGILQTDGSGNLSWLTPSALVTGIAWALTGNSGTDPAENFLGTTDAQPLVIRTNDTERMRVTATGNVGIGTSAPAQRLHVVGNVQFTGALMPAGAAGSTGQVLVSQDAGAAPEWWDIVDDGTTTTVSIGGGQIQIAANNVLPIWNAGQIQGNNVSGAAPNNGDILVWNAGTNQWEPNPVTVAGAWGLTGNGGTNPAFNFLGTTDDQPVIIKTNGVERMRISNSAYNGYVGIGDVDPAFRLELPNLANPAGRGRANSWVTYSSLRWKEDIRPIENALERVMQLRGYHFRWKPEYGGGRISASWQRRLPAWCRR